MHEPLTKKHAAPQDVVPQDLAVNMVNNLMQCFSSHNKFDSMIRDTDVASETILQRLLCLLKALISRPQTTFLFDIFEFLLTRFFPFIECEQASIAIEQSFFEVWVGMLIHYSALVQNSGVYQSYMNCLLHALRGSDIDIFKLVVEALIQAETKRHIFLHSLILNSVI